MSRTNEYGYSYEQAAVDADKPPVAARDATLAVDAAGASGAEEPPLPGDSSPSPSSSSSAAAAAAEKTASEKKNE